MASTKYRTADVDGFKVFYREAGPADAPKLLLLHGFPSAGHMFRDLIPLLSDRFHIVAPDLPGFGQSDMPPREKFSYRSTTSPASSSASPKSSASIGSRYTSLITVRRQGSGSPSATPSGSRLLSRRTATPMRKVLAMAGLRSELTGKTRRR
jgi:pimeloyl-ACP methyl ester carboxylesterase